MEWLTYDDPNAGGASAAIDMASFSVSGDIDGYVREVPWSHGSTVDVLSMSLDPQEQIQQGTFGFGSKISGLGTRITTKCRAFKYTGGDASSGTATAGDPPEPTWFTEAEF